MSYTFTERTADGSQTTFSFSFAGADKGYIRASDIYVEIWGGKTWQSATGWQLSGTNQITFNVPPSSGTVVRIRRIVGKDQPYANFDRNVILDMKSLNNSFIQQLELTQEMLDGFLPDSFYFKQDINAGWHNIYHLLPGTEGHHAVNKAQFDTATNNLQSQIDANDTKQTAWNQRQDEQIVGIIKSFNSNISHRTAPWTYEAAGGETKVSPPFFFNSALVWRDGVFQDELAGAFEVVNNEILLAQPALRKGERVSVLIGSRLAAPDVGSVHRMTFNIKEGATMVNLGMTVGAVEVSLDGLLQDEDAYTLGTDYRTLTFTEPLPECRMLVKAVFDNRTHLE